MKNIHETGIRSTAIKNFYKYKPVIDSLRDHPCLDCKNTFPIICMEFDHRPEETKLFTIGSKQAFLRPFWEVLDEVAKCDVVCSNCHKIRTHARRKKK